VTTRRRRNVSGDLLKSSKAASIRASYIRTEDDLQTGKATDARMSTLGVAGRPMTKRDSVQLEVCRDCTDDVLAPRKQHQMRCHAAGPELAAFM
jgi:hypothetical protein